MSDTGFWRVGRNLAVAGAWAVAYVLLEWLSFIHEYKGLPITPWNPGLGVVFAVLVRGTPWHGAILFAGIALSEFVVVDSALDWPEILILAAVMTAGYTGAAMLARRWQIKVGLDRLRDVLLLLGVGLAAALAVTVTLGLLFMAAGHVTGADVLDAALPLLVGDGIGIAVATPLVLRFWKFSGQFSGLRPRPAILGEYAAYTLVIVSVLLMTVGSEGGAGRFNYFYLIFLPVVAAALRHGLDGACASLALAQLGLVGLIHRHGFDVGTFTEYQSLMLVLSATGLIVGVVVSERAQAQSAARIAEENLKALETEAVEAARHNLVTGMASALAHEINQPMTAARALARSAQHLLTQAQADPARAGTNLGDLIAQIDHAGEIVRRMRGFLRRGVPRSSTVDIRNILDDAVMLARARAKERGVTIDVRSDAGLPPIFGDHIQLQQVVLNLVHNGIDAVAETGRGDGRVEVSARCPPGDGVVEVTVRDNGTGIAPEFAEKLFQPLTTSKPEGLGLGLSICSSIVGAHGGKIWLQNAAPGATEFRFTLPVPGGTL
ncbi:MAG: hypothetical protein RL477_801 [Pseudomonadota bacterium]|jgi:signal transduction histidine kinase